MICGIVVNENDLPFNPNKRFMKAPHQGADIVHFVERRDNDRQSRRACILLRVFTDRRILAEGGMHRFWL